LPWSSELRLARGAVGFAWYAACSMAPCPLAAGLRALPARSVPKQRCMPSSQKLGRTRTCSLPRRCRAVASASDSSSPPPWNANPEDQGNSPSSRPPSTRDEGPAAAPRSSGPSPQGLVPVPIVPGSGLTLMPNRSEDAADAGQSSSPGKLQKMTQADAFGLVLSTVREEPAKSDAFGSDRERLLNSVSTPSPRRTARFAFTCNICGEYTVRAINPHAYKHGAVFVQCSGCQVFHKVRAARVRGSRRASRRAVCADNPLAILSRQVADHINFLDDV